MCVSSRRGPSSELESRCLKAYTSKWSEKSIYDGFRTKGATYQLLLQRRNLSLWRFKVLEIALSGVPSVVIGRSSLIGVPRPQIGGSEYLIAMWQGATS